MSIPYQQIKSGWKVKDRFDNELLVLDDFPGITRSVQLIKGSENKGSKFVFNWVYAKQKGEKNWHAVKGPRGIVPVYDTGM